MDGARLIPDSECVNDVTGSILSFGLHGSRVGAGVVGQGREARGSGAEARQGLALAEAEVCERPDGPAAEGPLRAGRLEDGQRRCFSATSARTKDSFGRHWKLGDLAAEIANWRESNGCNPASESRKFNAHEQMRNHDLPPGWQSTWPTSACGPSPGAPPGFTIRLNHGGIAVVRGCGLRRRFVEIVQGSILLVKWSRGIHDIWSNGHNHVITIRRRGR